MSLRRVSSSSSPPRQCTGTSLPSPSPCWQVSSFDAAKAGLVEMVNQDNVVRMSPQPGPRRRNGQPQHPTSSNSPSSRPRRHVAQNAVACATACIVQPATWVLETPIADRLNKRKRAWSLSFHRVARRTNNMLAKFSIPTWTSSQPTPSPMTPLPCSDPGPRSRIPLAQWPNGPMAHFIPAFAIDSMRASFHHARNNNTPRGNVALRLRPNQGSASFSRSNTSCRDGPTSDQRARNLLPSHSISRAPSPDPPAVITMIRMALRTPSSRLQGRAQQAGSPPRRSAKIQIDSLTPPAQQPLDRMRHRPGLKHWLGAGGARGAETRGPTRAKPSWTLSREKLPVTMDRSLVCC